LFLAFAAALRDGEYIDGGKRASGATIEEALRWVAQCMVTRGLDDPRRAYQGQHSLDRRFSTYYRTCKDEDPPSRPQLALPSSTIRWIASQFGAAPVKRLRIVADLITLAFFFLLRVGEYTPSDGRRQKRTIPLRKKDIRLWRNGRILNHQLPLRVLLDADAITIGLENQKNGHKNATLHHTASYDSVVCPVRAGARLVHEIRNMSASTGLGTYTNEFGYVLRVQASEIRAMIHEGALGDGLESCGYDLTRVGSHSLRSGGATHLKLCGYDNDMIKKLGRWSSNTYLRYIQSQIGNLTHGIATQMAKILRFHNVAST